MSIWKKIGTFILAICLVSTFLMGSAYAEENETYDEGEILSGEKQEDEITGESSEDEVDEPGPAAAGPEVLDGEPNSGDIDGLPRDSDTLDNEPEEIPMPTIDITSYKNFGSYGVYVEGEPTFFSAQWLSDKFTEAYGKEIDVTAPGWHLIQSTSSDYSVEIVEDESGFQGIKVIGLKVPYTAVSRAIYYDYWPADDTGDWRNNYEHYTANINMRAIYNYENDGSGSIFGTNTIPAGSTGDYFYGTAYAGYERLFVSRGYYGYPIILNALVPMTSDVQEWTPDNLGADAHMDTWTADGTHNFEVAYCADSDTVVSDGGTSYQVAHVHGLDRFSSEEQQKLQAIIEHAYPFISEDDMLAELNEAGITLDVYGDYASELMMIATQFAIWNITNDEPADAKVNISGFRTEGYGIDFLSPDYNIVSYSFTADDCINNNTQQLISAGSLTNYNLSEFYAEIRSIMDYLNSCESSIPEDPELTIDWSYDNGQLTVTGKVENLRPGDIVQLENEVIDVAEDGSFTTTKAAAANTQYTITVTRSCGKIIEAMYFESDEYQNFVGGMLNNVELFAFDTYTTPDEPDNPPPPPYIPQPEEPKEPDPEPEPEPEIPEEPEVEIPEEEPPLEEEPEIPDEEPPLAELPELPEEPSDEIDIPEDDVPLDEIPQTGDSSWIWETVMVVSGLSLLILWIQKRVKRKLA